MALACLSTCLLAYLPWPLLAYLPWPLLAYLLWPLLAYLLACLPIYHVLSALLRLEVSTTCSSLVTPASVLLTMLVLVGAGIALPMQIGPMQRLELLREGEKSGPNTSDAPPVNAQAIGPGPGGQGETTERRESGE